MSILDILITKFQIGLDIFTALSVIIAASQYIKNSRKQASIQRKRQIEQANQLRVQRVSESGAIVLVNQLEKLSLAYSDLIKESNGITKKLKIFKLSEQEIQQTKITNTQVIEEFLKNQTVLDEITVEFEEFSSCFGNKVQQFYQQRYIVVPVLEAISKNKEEVKELVERVIQAPNNLTKIHNKLEAFIPLCKEMLNILKEIEQFDKNISFDDFSKIGNSQKNIIEQLYCTITNSNYTEYLNSILQDSKKLLSAQDKHSDQYKLLLANELYAVMKNEQRKCIAIHNLIEQVNLMINNARNAFKQVLCLLSACYSYILSSKEQEGNSLTKEVEYYKKIYELEENIIH